MHCCTDNGRQLSPIRQKINRFALVAFSVPLYNDVVISWEVMEQVPSVACGGWLFPVMLSPRKYQNIEMSCTTFVDDRNRTKSQQQLKEDFSQPSPGQQHHKGCESRTFKNRKIRNRRITAFKIVAKVDTCNVTCNDNFCALPECAPRCRVADAS